MGPGRAGPEYTRGSGNYREYNKASLARLTFIKRGRDLGFSIDQVSQLMNLTRSAGENCATVDAIAVQHLAAVDRKIADLTALRRELTGLVDSCAGGSIGDCDILRALSPEGTEE
ncbi:MerR family DNA-binding protein [Altererythrobacter sp. B11]|uniref:MerR family DNA-binding protein n=1 Tax=Altererythrobacter sp. B11 TaxID=2060312 RepID=UPI001E39447C|nr:MerR family DNA-binding protein [Altererythrobacter sp. B11]